MSSVEPVRMLDAEPHPSFELTELDAPEEELLGRYLPIGDVAKSIGVNPSVLRFWEQEFPQLRPTKRGNRRYYCSEDVALIRGSERSPDIGNGNPLQYSCPENTMNRFCDPLVGYSPGPHKQSDMTGHTHM